MKEYVEDLTKRLEIEISNTPTGEKRELLTDANIMAQYLLSPEIVDCNGLSSEFIQVVHQLVEIQRKNEQKT